MAASKPGDREAARDRLQPALLDRLTDDEPNKTTEAPQQATMTRARLRAAVLRDLSSLLNSTNMESEFDLTDFPAVRRSTLNYGVPVLSGQRIADVDWQDLEIAIRDAIVTFEPRVLPDTIQVRGVTTTSSLDHHNMLSFEIRGQLWSLPYPLELLLRSNLDVESGQVVLRDEST
ncbi:MAG: type VI secretion system baseplate subunit TssE [Pseudomonadota bacterium]|nr:type VI secretion system baseplate subunit TssE [Pseudomonadota bacterium]